MAMKVSGEEMIRMLQGVKQQNRVQTPAKNEQSGSTEKVDFSSELQQANKSSEMTRTSDAERAEKVESLKQQISNGTYNPDMKDVASSLLDYLSKMGS